MSTISSNPVMEPCNKDSKESNGSTKDVSMKNSLHVTIYDPHAFDCCVCLQLLTIPVFKCDNGHIVCSTCCDKLGNKCDKCSKQISLKRSRSFEDRLQSIKHHATKRHAKLRSKTLHQSPITVGELVVVRRVAFFCFGIRELRFTISLPLFERLREGWVESEMRNFIKLERHRFPRLH
ncbi:hypothetical protein RYX36_032776 [Vicia faba]